MKILIVDDSRAMRMIVRRTLRQAGFGSHPVTEAANGAEAFESIQSTPPDVVLCDWNMPEMTGIQLLQKLNDTGGRKPIFGFVTSEGTAPMRHQAAEAGATFFIAKPFTVEAFEKALAPVLG